MTGIDNRASPARAARAYNRFAQWMEAEVLPFWATIGLSKDGGVVERMTLDGRPDRPGFKRVRVHARQLYVFSHAHTLGIANMLPAAQTAFDFLTAHGRDENGGWVVKMGESGGIVDAERDLYDQAFVILAMVWWSRASGGGDGVRIARETLDVINRDFARPDGRGFLSRLPDQGRALQNPHMHLLEGVLALHAQAPDAASLDTCNLLLALYHEALFDAATGTLGEFFETDWKPASGAEGQVVEPGHHYEWAWLLEMAERAGLGDADPAATAMFAFAEAHGLLDTPGDCTMIHDTVDRQGRVTSDAHRSWPQTERLKALAVRAERTGEADYPAIAGALDALWTHYLEPAPYGCWIDHVDAALKPAVSAVPASTLYHLFLAYAELRRCAGTLFDVETQMADGS